MSSNRIRVLLMSLLAVVAVGAVASATASAHEWKVCREEVAATFKYKSLAECWAGGVGTGGKWERLALPQEVTVSGGTFTLAAGVKKITCTALTHKGFVETGGKDEATEIKFTGCTTSQAGCSVKTAGEPNGTLKLTELDTLLVERKPAGGGAAKLADEFKPDPPHTAFVTLKFEGTCSEFPETEVTGQMAGFVENATEELNFPSPELEGNTLRAFGKAAKLAGKLKYKLVNGGNLEGV